MAMWLWVDKLDPKNDWIMLKSFQFGGSQNPYGGQGQGRGHLRSSDFHEATFTLDPGRFLTRLYSWVINGDQRTVYVFFDPQTEYEFSATLAIGLSTGGPDNKTTLMTINWVTVKVTHSGAP